MGVKNPTTYGDYWAAQKLEADQILAGQMEAELSAVASRLMLRLRLSEITPPEFTNLFKDIEAPAGAFLGEVGGRFVSEVADGAVSKAASPFFESMGYAAYNLNPTKKMSPASTSVLFSRGKITEDLLLERYRMAGFEPIEAKFQYDSMRAYPSIPDLILYSRYHGDPEYVWGELNELFDVDPVDRPLWEWLALQRHSTDDVCKLFRRGKIEDYTTKNILKQIGWSENDTEHVIENSWLLPNAMLLVQGDLQQEKYTDKILEDISKADIHPDYAQTYLDAILTKPSPIDVIAYELRQNPDLRDIEKKLTKIGIHGDYLEVYKTLAWQIPPVADIITMAVREAFTPAIAARFGQYDDFPTPLKEWGEKKGLSEEWTQRYWAAHWSLPSPQQGFEMLHRGVIDQPDLNMLLRALDVMPFWRDKLTAIAYRPLTRVDVRRMYKEGILDEKGVYEAYLDHGYSDENAERMTEFTVKFVLTQQARFTTTDVVAAYTKRMISRGEASSLLDNLGVRSNNISYILSTADYKKQWALTDSRISAIRNLYKKHVYDQDKTQGELLRLNLPSEQVQVLLEQWYYEDKSEISDLWTKAETLKFLAAGIISSSRAIEELGLMGYDSEHINAYLGAVA